MPLVNHEWSIVAGYVAPIQSWLMPAAYADQIMDTLSNLTDTDREATLTLGDPNNPTIVERVYVAGTAPGNNPQRKYLLLADVRFYLGFQVFVVDANVRRRLGDRRLVGAGLVTSTLADTVGYQPWSINKDTAYTWGTFKDQALNILLAPKNGRPTIEFVTDSIGLSITPQVIQETTTDSDGTAGLARAIETLPGAGVYPDLKGVLHIYDATPGAEKTLVSQLPKALMHHGNLTLVDLSGMRPSKWRVFFDYAIEVRFDYRLATGPNAVALDNVLQVTDQTLSIPKGDWGAARLVGQGTWITMDEAFAAWGGKSIGPLTLPALSDDFVADHWFGDLLQVYTLGGGLSPDPVWSMRIQELMRCYRTYFRVNKDFWNQVRHWWTSRIAVWDPVTGTRAPSPVYSNYHFMAMDNLADANIAVFGQDVLTSMPTNMLLKDASPSGFQVEMVDEDLMIFMVNRNIARFPGHTQLLPSPVITKATVTGAPGENDAWLQRLQHKDKLAGAQGWQLSTILTCSPASPNDPRRLYESVVYLADVVSAIGGLKTDVVCCAPDQEMRSHVTEARVGWTDDGDTPKNILKVFGNGDAGVIGANPSIKALQATNYDRDLKPLSIAMAAADLIPKLDHYEGSLAVPMSGDVLPIGSITRVIHKVTHNRAVTVLQGTACPRKIDFTEFLRGSARSYLLKQIQKAQ